jgi:hypothetical protein
VANSFFAWNIIAKFLFVPYFYVLFNILEILLKFVHWGGGIGLHSSHQDFNVVLNVRMLKPKYFKIERVIEGASLEIQIEHNGPVV